MRDLTMRANPFAVRLLSILCFAAAFAHAEIIVGKADSNQMTPDVINVFADNADGDSAPLRTIVTGPDNPIVTGGFIEFEPGENVLYVADFWGQAIRVYEPHASGDAAPLRTMSSPLLGQVRAVRIDRAHDEMVALAGLCCIYTWPRLADGSGANPIRRIPWGGNHVSSSQLNNPLGLALNRERGEIVVGDYENSAPEYPNRIIFFSRLDDGSETTPLRVISGPNTQLGGGSNVRVAVDEETQTVFALVGPSDGDIPDTARVLAFSADAEGDAIPLRVISGPSAGLVMAPGEYPGGLGFDENSGHLLVSINNMNPQASGRVLVYDKDGDGGPLAILSGDATGITSSPGSVAVTFDRLFKNGFDGY